MIADSSSRLQRNSTGGSLATALRDRGPCVIPVQPNRSLPIRPAPPTPTRSAASIVMSRKTRSPILKLSKPVSLDVVEVQSEKSLSDTLTGELSFPFGQQDGKSDGMMLTSELIDQTNYILPDMANVVQVVNQSLRSQAILTAIRKPLFLACYIFQQTRHFYRYIITLCSLLHS